MTDNLLCIHVDFSDKAKIARSDNQVAYKQFAKMVIPKHVENIIEDEEEFGETPQRPTQAVTGARPQASRTAAGSAS